MSRIRAIIYFSNNSSLLAIIMRGLPISNEFIFLDEVNIHFPYVTYVKYKNPFFTFSRSNENSLLEVTAHKTISHCLSFNIYLELWQSQFLKTRQMCNDQFSEGWSRTVVFAPLIYICMKNSMYSRLMRNLSISIEKSLNSCDRDWEIPRNVESPFPFHRLRVALWFRLISSWPQHQYIQMGTNHLMVEPNLNIWTHLYFY